MKLLLLNRIFWLEKNVKNILYLMLNTLLMFILLCFVVYNILSPGVYYRAKMGAYLYSNFDVRLMECSEQMYMRIVDNDNVESVLSTPLTIGEAKINKGDKSVTSNLMPIYSDSLEILNDIVVTPNLLVKKDDTLLKREDSIAIALEIAMALDADIGDQVDMGILGEYTVAGIYENSIGWTIAPLIGSMVTYNRNIREYFQTYSSTMKKGDIRSLIYIRFKDKDAGRKYIKENYIADLNLFLKYGEDYLNKVEENNINIDRYRSYGAWRDDLLEVAEFSLSSSYTYKVKALVLITGFGLICMCTLLVHESTKRINQNMKQIAILSICGLSKKSIFSYFAFTVLIKQIIVQGVIIYLYKNFFMLRIVNGTYVPNDIILKFIPLFLSAIVISALVSGLFAAKRVSSKLLLESLNYSEVHINE